MADVKKYLDYTGLSHYDEKIKKYSDNADAQVLVAAKAYTDEKIGDYTAEIGESYATVAKAIAGEKAARETADGNLADLAVKVADETVEGGTRTAKDLVEAINAINSKAAGETGALEDLNTTDKSSIVAAINEIVNEIDDMDGSITSNTDTPVTVETTQEDGKITKIEVSVNEATTTYTAYREGIAKEADTPANLTVDNEDDLLTGAAIANIKSYVDDVAKASISVLDADVVQSAGDDGLALEVIQKDGKITSISGSIAANTYMAYEDLGALTTDTKTVVGSVNELDAAIDALGTAAEADVATAAIGNADEVKDALPTVAQVEKYLEDEMADLANAMHFLDVFDSLDAVTKTDADGNAVALEAGDFVLIGTKEYVYTKSGEWKELGDEGTHVTKSTTIAGIDLENNITEEELRTAFTKAESSETAYVKDTTEPALTVTNEAGLATGADIANVKKYADDVVAKALDSVDSIVANLNADKTSDDDVPVKVQVVEEDGKISDVAVSMAAASVSYTAATEDAEAALAATEDTGVVVGSDIATVKSYVDAEDDALDARIKAIEDELAAADTFEEISTNEIDTLFA